MNRDTKTASDLIQKGMTWAWTIREEDYTDANGYEISIFFPLIEGTFQHPTEPAQFIKDCTHSDAEGIIGAMNTMKGIDLLTALEMEASTHPDVIRQIKGQVKTNRQTDEDAEAEAQYFRAHPELNP